MRRVFTLALVLGLLAGAMSTASAEPSWAERQRSARFRSLEGSDRTFSDREVVLTVKAAFRRIAPGHVSTALRVADCESGFNEYAYNSSSGASGVFQHLAHYWPGRTTLPRSTGPLRVRVGASVFNARANAIVAAYMVRSSGWGAWSCY